VVMGERALAAQVAISFVEHSFWIKRQPPHEAARRAPRGGRNLNFLIEIEIFRFNSE
jgi:hypothetical protein